MELPLEPSVRLLVVGLNYKTAPLHVREGLAFAPERLRQALEQLKQAYPQAEMVILSTCNRVELYVARPIGAMPTRDDLTAFLEAFHQMPAGDFHAHLYHHEDRHMIEHLFGVTSSLDSMVVGETQILAQVKQAYQTACDAGSVGTVFHALFQRSLAAAKTVHEKTLLTSGRVSVASVGVDLARSVFDRFDDKTVLCIGAGKMTTLMLRHMLDLQPQQVLIANRSLERAQTLAKEFKAQAHGLEDLPSLLVTADIILTSTGATDPIITTATFKSLLRPRRYRPVVIVDMAVPRDVEAGVGELNNVYLYNIDDLQRVAGINRDKREAVVTQSRQLLHDHVEEFLGWFTARHVGPLVRALYHQTDELARLEMEDFLRRHPELTETQRQDVERLMHRTVRKFLHMPVSQITHRTQASARPMLAVALRKLFDLNGEEPQPDKTKP